MDISISQLIDNLASSSSDTGMVASSFIPAEFPSFLEAAQSPPIPEPPPPPAETSGEKEQQTTEANAQSEKPDLSSQDHKAEDSSKKVKKPAQASQAAASAVAGGVASAVPTAKPASTVAPSQAGPQADKAVSPVTAKPAAASEAKVSLSNLPVDPVATVVSATVAPEAATPQIAVPAAAGIQAPPTAPASAVDPTSVLAQVAFPDSNSPDPGLAVSDLPSTQLALVTPNAAVESLQVASLNSLSTQSPGPSDVRVSPAGKPDPDNVMHTLVPTQVTSGQANGGQASGSGSQSNANPNQSQAQVQTSEVVKQITEHTENVALRAASENVTVHLQTEDDTNVTMMVKSAHGQVQAQFMTNNEALRNALHQNRPQLAQTLETKGLNLGQVSVGLKNSSSRQDPSGGRPNQGGSSKSMAQTPTKQSGRIAKNSLDAGVDLWI
jgi:hypothetical protein